jgi:transposase
VSAIPHLRFGHHFCLKNSPIHSFDRLIVCGLKAITSMVGKARASKYPYRQLSEWAKRGGRPRAIEEKQSAELLEYLGRGLSQKECAERLGGSLSSVVRAVKRLRERGTIE